MELSRDQIRAIIYYEWLELKDASEIHIRMNNRLGQNFISKSTVEYWFREFQRGRHSVKDEFRSGRPSTSTADQNVEMVREVVKENREITYDTLEKKTGISRGSLHSILKDKLNATKKISWFVPHFLTDEQKKIRVDICHENLRLCRNRANISRILTGDETYVYFYDAPTRSESRIWVFDDEPSPQVVKRDRTVGKVLYAVFFRSTGLVQAVKLEGQRSVTALWYTTQCLPKVFEGVENSGLILLHDNASSHTANLTSQHLAQKKIRVLRHPPYSPDLAMADFWLFAGLKRNLRGRFFKSEQDLDLAVHQYFDSIPESDWSRAFDLWKSRMERCIEAKGEYFSF